MSDALPLVHASAGPGADFCVVCRSALAPDQRYCLQCGARRDGARLEFLDVLAEPQAPPRQLNQATPPGGGRSRWLKDGSVLGAAVVLVGTLVAGLLIGHWAGGSGDASGTSTQVVRLIGAGGASAGTADVTPAAAAATGAAVAKKKTKTKAKTAAAAKTFNPNAAPVKVTPESESQALNDTSGTEDLSPKDTNPNGANFDEIP